MRNLIIPKPGNIVRDPLTGKILPPEGLPIASMSVHWKRRLREGSVTIVPERAVASTEGAKLVMTPLAPIHTTSDPATTTATADSTRSPRASAPTVAPSLSPETRAAHSERNES